jgi:uncharacterized protein YggE
MAIVLLAVILGFSLFGSPAHAQGVVGGVGAVSDGAQAPNSDAQTVRNHVITVSRSGEAFAKPDLGILVMSIRSTSPIMDEAVTENTRKAKDVQSALTGLGFAAANYEISSVMFAPAAGPRIVNEDSVSVYDATQYVYVYFQADELRDVATLTQKAAAVIEALRKAGAVPANTGTYMVVGPAAAQGALVIYTVKDPAPYEQQASQVAVGRARDAAQAIATAAGVQIAGLRSIQSPYLAGNVMPRAGASPLEGLKYRFFSTKINELQIIANVTLEYDFK